jgi:hypothetical protein
MKSESPLPRISRSYDNRFRSLFVETDSTSATARYILHL